MTLHYVSLFSGIEAFSVADWEAATIRLANIPPKPQTTQQQT